MFRWYSGATTYYAYIEDFSVAKSEPGASGDFPMLKDCQWFSRGWTLQELLAPRHVFFYDVEWVKLGQKDEMHEVLQEITSIPGGILRKEKGLDTVSVAVRMSWAARRQTSREDHEAYCLMGIFNVTMPMVYGEGRKAFLRLQDEIMKLTNDGSLFAWCADANSAASAPYRGLFASYPKEFVNCVDIAPFGVDSPDAAATTMIGNGRFSFNRTMYNLSGDDRRVVLGLKCYRGNLASLLGIEAVCIGADRYLRSSPSQLVTMVTFGRFQNINIDRHALKMHVGSVTDPYRHDGIEWSRLPAGVRLKAVHSSKTSLPTRNFISLVDSVRCKTAFELGVSKHATGDGQPHIGSGKDSTVLLLCWVNPQSTPASLGSYNYYFNVVWCLEGDGPSAFRTAKRPTQQHETRDVLIGWSKLKVVGRRKVQDGHATFHLEVTLTIRQDVRTATIAASDAHERIARVERRRRERKGKGRQEQMQRKCLVTQTSKKSRIVMGMFFVMSSSSLAIMTSKLVRKAQSSN